MTPTDESRVARELGEIKQKLDNLASQMTNTVNREVFEARMAEERAYRVGLERDLRGAEQELDNLKAENKERSTWVKQTIVIAFLAPIIVGIVVAWVVAKGLTP